LYAQNWGKLKLIIFFSELCSGYPPSAPLAPPGCALDCVSGIQTHARTTRVVSKSQGHNSGGARSKDFCIKCIYTVAVTVIWFYVTISPENLL